MPPYVSRGVCGWCGTRLLRCPQPTQSPKFTEDWFLCLHFPVFALLRTVNTDVPRPCMRHGFSVAYSRWVICQSSKVVPQDGSGFSSIYLRRLSLLGQFPLILIDFSSF